MLHGNMSFVELRCKSSVQVVASVFIFALFLGCWPLATRAQQQGQQTFASAEEAAHAFFAATQAQNEKALLSILGPDGKGVISSGDDTEDFDARAKFAEKYQEMHRFVKEAKGTETLVVGAENWPFPIRLVNNNGSWYFDTVAGKGEILFRRIGRNELAAMDACRDLVDAQRQYFARAAGNLTKQYAQKLVSDEGRHNGLYWHGASDEFESPINPLIAFAHGRGPGDQSGGQVPFNGYLFRILTTQGSHAMGGAKTYIVDGKMTKGFAFVAYPAEYRSSGVLTFIVDQSGSIYEKDLGSETEIVATAMTAFDPDSTWHKIE
jgi:hypothetical protein